MNAVITSEVLQAYSLCPRKAYLLMYGNERGKLHEYEQILIRNQLTNQSRNLEILKKKHTNVYPYGVSNFEKRYQFLIDANLATDKYQANCSILTRVDDLSYEPTIFIGTYTVNNTDKLNLMFVSHILSKIQGKLPEIGQIINMKGESKRLKLEESHKVLTPLLEPLQEWLNESILEEPPVILNKHCSVCQFRDRCQAKAIQEDNLSLLDRITPKVIRQYEKKGIFTVKQLSFLFKPRKRKKRLKNPPLIVHNIELQALAIRTGKIYLKELSTLSRKETELYLDIEGVPDENFYYLIGLIVCQDSQSKYYSFWADTSENESEMWRDFLAFVVQYANAPIYHYGSYEIRAINTLSQRYKTDINSITSRIVNVNAEIYGKVYFPSYSNRLKEIASFIGFSWTSPDASGLQSIVWRNYWDKTHDIHHKSALLIYNEEDCKALKALVEELAKIKNFSDSLSNVNFADQLKKQCSESGQKIQSQFEEILKFAHMDYDKKKIKFRNLDAENINEEKEKKKRGISKKGYQGQRKIKPKISKVIHVAPADLCPNHPTIKLKATDKTCKRVIIDLVITSSGVKKITPQYIGNKSHCPECRKDYNPPKLLHLAHSRLYGHGFKAWTVYHRVAIRIPYEGICEMLKEQFREVIYAGSIVTFIKDFANYYSETEKIIIKSLLKSSTIHADETKVNINGFNWYGWVFTNENYSVFKLTETREATIAHELLLNYDGVLISDLYSGYDSVNCKQQKCWVHLIRDLNDDLCDSPFDIEYEKFVLGVKNLIIPVLQKVDKYGLKKRHLSQFMKEVDKFYKTNILDIDYKSELVLKYQKRFIRYQDSLFTFLEKDGVPWHNNFAERAIRHLAIQRDNSTAWQESPTKNYFILLSIQQTCRFQGKSFFKFLFSGETDIDQFKARKNNF